jgi:hypothetical protein
MTIALSLICENDKEKYPTPSIVIAADRMVSSQNVFSYDLGKPKFAPITEGSTNPIILKAGDLGNLNDVLERNKTLLEKESHSKNKKYTIMEFSKLLRTSTNQIKEELINNSLLNPIGLTLNEFKKNVKKFPKHFIRDTTYEIRETSLNAFFIVAGFDLEKGKTPIAHMNYINNGKLSVLDEEAGVIGVGALLAASVINKNKYNFDISLSDAVQRAYWAKKAAEDAPGVGNKITDMAIMYCKEGKKGKYTIENAIIDAPFINLLEKNYQKFNLEEQKTINKIQNELLLEIEKIKRQ